MIGAARALADSLMLAKGSPACKTETSPSPLTHNMVATTRIIPIGALRLRGRRAHRQQPVPRLAFSKPPKKSDHGIASTWSVGNVGSNRPYVTLCQATL